MNYRAIDFVVVFVADMTRAVNFYRDTLGISLAEGDDDYHPVWNELDTHPVTIALYANEETAGSNASIGLAVADVASAVEELRGMGHMVVMEPIETPVCWMANVRDPDGNMLILHQRKDGTAG